MRGANAAGWAVERANPAERTTDPHSLAGRPYRHEEDCEFALDESGIRLVGDATPRLCERISGERLGATLLGLGLLEEFLSSDGERATEDKSGAPAEEGTR